MTSKESVTVSESRLRQSDIGFTSYLWSTADRRHGLDADTVTDSISQMWGMPRIDPFWIMNRCLLYPKLIRDRSDWHLSVIPD
jgi:hypothetical protein